MGVYRSFILFILGLVVVSIVYMAAMDFSGMFLSFSSPLDSYIPSSGTGTFDGMFMIFRYTIVIFVISWCIKHIRETQIQT